jgi:hypothetical protein
MEICSLAIWCLLATAIGIGLATIAFSSAAHDHKAPSNAIDICPDEQDFGIESNPKKGNQIFFIEMSDAMRFTLGTERELGLAIYQSRQL